MKLYHIIVVLSLLPCDAIAQHENGKDQSLPALYHTVTESLVGENPKKAIRIFEGSLANMIGGRKTELSRHYFAMALILALNGYYHHSIRYHKKALHAHRKYYPYESPVEIEINLGLTYELAGKSKKAKKLIGPFVGQGG